MRTKEDKIKQARTEINVALAKRAKARQMWEEAEEELIIAKMKMEDAMNESKTRQRRINADTSALYGRWA